MNAIGNGKKTNTECIRLQTDVSNERELLLLVDTGADITLLKPNNLDKTRTYDPEGNVKVKGVDGSIIETLGTVRTVVKADSLKIPFTFQLVNKQVDIPCDGILGRDFLQHAGAQIFYASGTLTFGTGCSRVSKPLSPISAESQTKRIRRLVLPGRTELVVKLPVKDGTRIQEGVTEKQEIQEGVYLAGAMTRVQAGYAISSIANTNSEEVEIDEPVLEVTEIVSGTEDCPHDATVSDKQLTRAEEVLKWLILDHLNTQEREQVEKTCADYHDIFHLQGEILTSTTAIRHEIRIEPGVKPVNVKPYRLPEAQKQEVRGQVEELRQGGS